MSITGEDTRIVFVGDGNDNSPYAISFPLRVDTSVEVIYVTDATGAEVVKTITTDYTIAVSGAFTTAALTLVTTAPATGETLLIRRNEPATRLSNYKLSDGQPAAVSNNDFDVRTMSEQTLQEQLDRVLMVAKGHPDANLPLTPLNMIGSAGLFVVVNSGETDFELLAGSNITGAGTLNTIPLWTPDGSTLGDSVITQSSTLITVAGTLTVNSDAVGTTILGRAKIGTTTGNDDVAVFAHFDHFTSSSFALEQSSLGHTFVNAAINRNVTLSINDTGELTVTGTVVEIPSNEFRVTIGDVNILAGALSVEGLITASSTVLTTAAGLLRHQAIDPAIAGAGLTVNTGILSVDNAAALVTLSDNSMADTLHRHSELSASDGSPDQVLAIDAIGNMVITSTKININNDNNPTIFFDDTTAGPADGSKWRLGSSGTAFFIGPATDDESSGPAAIFITRNTVPVVTEIVLDGTVISLGNLNAGITTGTLIGKDPGVTGGDLQIDGNGTVGGTLHLVEKAGAVTVTAGTGQVWVKDDTPNTLWFTDDDDVDFQLAVAVTHTIASHSDTSGTGPQLDTLTNNSMADTLHRHSELSASDGTPDAVVTVDAVGSILLDAASGQTVALAVNATEELQVSGTAVTIPTNGLIVTLGDVSIGAGTTPDARLEVGTGTQWSSGNFGANIVVSGARNNVIGFLDAAGNNPWAIGVKPSGDLEFNTMPALGDTGNPPVLRVAFNATGIGIGNAPTLPFDVNAKAGTTSIGGYTIKLTNKSGGSLPKGTLVIASTGTADAFDIAGVSDDRVIGIVYDHLVGDGNEVWIVVSGFAEVLMDAGGAALGDRIISSATAGSGFVSNGPASAAHFQEVGHAVGAGGAGALVKCAIHLN